MGAQIILFIENDLTFYYYLNNIMIITLVDKMTSSPLIQILLKNCKHVACLCLASVVLFVITQ